MYYWLKRPVHVSYGIALMSLGVVVGAFMAQMAGISVAWLALAGILAIVGFSRLRIMSVPMVVIAGLLGGWVRASVYEVNIEQAGKFIGQSVTIDGVVSDDVTTNTSGVKQVSIGSMVINEQSVAGLIEVGLSANQTIRRSDHVRVEGVLATGFGSYVGSIYQARLVRWTDGHDVAVTVRDWFVTAVRRAISEPESSLGIGYLVGQKSALPADLVTALQIAGLTHVVVASGYNLTILVRLSRRLLMRISKFTAMAGSVTLVLCMIAVTGLSPSMMRAGLVTGLSLTTWYYGRTFHPLILLPFAAAVTVLIQPSYAWGDIGWALSFTAFAGVMVGAPLFQRFFFGIKEPGTARQILGETVAAHIATAPVILFVFGQLSNVALFTNILVLPLVPLAMLLTFIAGVGALLIPGIAWLVGLPAQWLLNYMVWVTNLFADLPWAQTIIHIPPWVLVVSYLLIVTLCAVLWRLVKYNPRGTSVID